MMEKFFLVYQILNFGSIKNYNISDEIINCPFQLNNFVEKINVIFLKNKF